MKEFADRFKDLDSISRVRNKSPQASEYQHQFKRFWLAAAPRNALARKKKIKNATPFYVLEGLLSLLNILLLHLHVLSWLASVFSKLRSTLAVSLSLRSTTHQTAPRT